jgi:hypothetical protein
MKLLLCLSCHDVVKFGQPMRWRSCHCGASSARYLSDGVSAQFSGEHARALGVDNTSVAQALKSLDRSPKRDDYHTYPRLDVWLFPEGHYRVQRIDPPSAEPPQRRPLTTLDLLEPPTLKETEWDDEPFPPAVA